MIISCVLHIIDTIILYTNIELRFSLLYIHTRPSPQDCFIFLIYETNNCTNKLIIYCDVIYTYVRIKLYSCIG